MTRVAPARPAPRSAALPLAALALVALAACHSGAKPGKARPAAGDSVEVGYGSASRRDVTGSISSVDGETARKNTVTSMADLLIGRVPGLEVRKGADGNFSVRIRGDRSLKSDGEPLFVVDGIPVVGAGFLNDLDPREVKSIDVLKDAGSLAAYGSRGANGVILITLKKPPRP